MIFDEVQGARHRHGRPLVAEALAEVQAMASICNVEIREKTLKLLQTF